MIHLPPEAGIDRTYNVYPVQEAEWSTKTHEAPFTPIRITNGNLKCSVGYGPIEIKGVFSHAEIKKIWPDAPIDNDWNFSIVLFNCHLDSVRYHMYCYVRVDAETNQCTADLYIFKNGFAKVRLNGKENLIDTNGNLLSDQWFDSIFNYFVGGFAIVGLNRKDNFIDTNGNLLSDQWFDRVWDFNEYGIAEVRSKHNSGYDIYNFIDTKGNLVFNKWFDLVGGFYKGVAKVIIDGNKERFIDTKGNINVVNPLRYTDV